MVVDWGNVPSWISAVGSLAAFGIAAWAARAAWKQVEHLNETKEHEQASKVAAWLSIDKQYFQQHAKHDYPAVVLRYVNASDLPVYDLHATAVDDPSIDRLRIEVVEPASDIEVAYLDGLTVKLNKAYRINMSRFEDIDMDPEKREGVEGLALKAAALEVIGSGIYIRFRDTRNVTWCRQANGVLRKPRFDSDGDDIDDPDYREIKNRQMIRRVFFEG